MEINAFIKNVADQFDELGDVELTPETKFKELDDWSSLTALLIISMIDEEYSVLLKGEDIRAAETLQDLFNIVKIRV